MLVPVLPLPALQCTTTTFLTSSWHQKELTCHIVVHVPADLEKEVDLGGMMVLPGVELVLPEAGAVVLFVGEVVYTIVVGMVLFQVFDYVALFITIHDSQACCRKRHGQYPLCNIRDV